MPSDKVLKAKEAYVDELTEKIKKSVCGIIVDYKGISVENDTKLRKSLREGDVEYFVVKNTLLKRALAKAGIEGIDDTLEGTTAIGLSDKDIITAPKLLYKYSTDSKGAFKIKSGFMEGKSVSVETIEEYAKLPSKEVLVSKLLFMLQSPMQRMAIAISEIAKKNDGAA